MASAFNEATQAYFRKYFDFFDTDKIGRVRLEDLPALVRACGAAPLEADVDLLKATADPDGRMSCDFDGVCRALKQAFESSVRAEDALEALQGFDPDGKGLMKPHELRFFLTTKGDALSQEEMNEFMEEMRSEIDTEGNLVFADVIDKMTPEMFR